MRSSKSDSNSDSGSASVSVDRAARGPRLVADPLSDVLSTLRVRSTLSSRFEGRGSWALRFPAYEHIKFGGVLAGRVHLWIDGEDADRASLAAGDFYLLTNGRPFCSASDLGAVVQEGVPAVRSHRGADGIVRYGSTGELASIASGQFAFDNEAAALLLRHLPPLIAFRASAPGSRPLAGLLDLLAFETGESRPGAAIAKANLAVLVLVQALRAYLDSVPHPEGWLGAVADARIGAALSSLHADLAHRWTVAALAAEAGMSRAAFAVRFKALVGATPLDYLGRWRLVVARTALHDGDDSVAAIAERVGYRSETAFSLAFKRMTGQSPRRFRGASRERSDGSA